jgi:oligopeptidase B
MKLPPVAAQKPHEFTIHRKKHVDEYWWLQDKTKPEVQGHLKAENDYASAFMRPHKKLSDTLYKEIRSRIKEDDSSVPVKDGPYDYYTRVEKGKQYAIHCRREGEKGKEAIILDENKLAKGQKYFSLGDADVSPDHRLLAYSTDVTGNEDHTLYIKRLDTGELLNEKVTHIADFVWAEDNEHIFYSLEEHPYPPRKIFRHKLGDDQTKDVLVYEEADPQWYVALGKSRSGDYIFIYAANYTTTEARFIPASEPLREPKLIAARRPKVRYYVEHHGPYFYITTNEKAVNYKVMRTLVARSFRNLIANTGKSGLRTI